MENGISLYPGLDNSFEENLDLLEAAAQQGIHRVFTSFHIPETDPQRFKTELRDLLHAARASHMEIISDVSPQTLQLLDMDHFSLSAFHFLGISTLRLDYGYTASQIAEFSHNPQHIRIQLNASTITASLLNELLRERANFSQIDALHNFYPRENTGLSEETFVRKNMMLHKAGIRVGAFVPSQYRRRGPLHAGLPTLEAHRELSVSLAARHLAAMGIDSVFISDSLPSEDELHALKTLRNDAIVLRAKKYTKDPVQNQLLAHTFSARIDEARDAIRAQESRPLLKGVIAPENIKVRAYGAVTLDNKNYQRYMGELQIIKRPQPADDRTNVAAQVLEEESILIPYIIPGKKFAFEFYNDSL